MDTFANLLSTSDRKQFNTWITQFGQVTVDASDPNGVSDRMEITLVLYGMGSGQPGKPGKAEETAMFTWAQNLFQKLYS